MKDWIQLKEFGNQAKCPWKLPELRLKLSPMIHARSEPWSSSTIKMRWQHFMVRQQRKPEYTLEARVQGRMMITEPGDVASSSVSVMVSSHLRSSSFSFLICKMMRGLTYPTGVLWGLDQRFSVLHLAQCLILIKHLANGSILHYLSLLKVFFISCLI